MSKKPSGEKPIEEQHREAMNMLGHLLEQAFPKQGFCLLIFDFAKPGATEPTGRMNYISNAERKDMISSLKEFIAYNEGKELHEGTRTKQ